MIWYPQESILWQTIMIALLSNGNPERCGANCVIQNRTKTKAWTMHTFFSCGVWSRFERQLIYAWYSSAWQNHSYRQNVSIYDFQVVHLKSKLLCKFPLRQINQYAPISWKQWGMFFHTCWHWWIIFVLLNQCVLPLAKALRHCKLMDDLYNLGSRCRVTLTVHDVHFATCWFIWSVDNI